MKICIFHGRKGNTDKIISIVKEKLIRECEGNVEFTDFYLPKDLPEFCAGCFACLSRGSRAGEFCPHRKYTDVISKSLEECDGIIIGCPVYALAESAQVKALFDHYACTYMNHRPKKSNFKKSALILSSCAGAGNRHTIKTIKKNFIFWGIPKIYSLGIKMWTADWDEMTDDKQNKFTKDIEGKTRKFINSIKNRKEGYAPLRTKILFTIFRHLVKTYPDGQKDKIYYTENGWFNKKRPWKD